MVTSSIVIIWLPKVQDELIRVDEQVEQEVSYMCTYVCMCYAPTTHTYVCAHNKEMYSTGMYVCTTVENRFGSLTLMTH